MSTVPNPPQMPPPEVPVIDRETGKMNVKWRDYFQQADDRLRKLTALS
jgi:hypothetical protein